MPLPTDFCTKHCSTSGSFQMPAGAIAHTPTAREETHRPRASWQTGGGLSGLRLV